MLYWLYHKSGKENKKRDIFEAIDSRHSVRQYKPIPLSSEHKKALIEKIEEILNAPQEISSEPTTEERILESLSTPLKSGTLILLSKS